MKKLFAILFALLFPLSNNIIACAMPQEAQKLVVCSSNFTQESAYVELLINMSEDDSNYTAFNSENMNSNGIENKNFDTKELSEYRDDDGYISVSCHLKNNYTRMMLKKEDANGSTISRNGFIIKKEKDGKFWSDTERMNDFRNCSPSTKFKVAVLDKSGKILQTSEPFEIISDNGYLWGDVNYDVKNNKVTLEWEKTMTTKQVQQLEFLIIAAIVFVFIILPAIIVLIIIKLIKREKHKHNFTCE